jgi:glycerol-3-phosphate dehydrogenase (NAD(P)+)
MGMGQMGLVCSGLLAARDPAAVTAMAAMTAMTAMSAEPDAAYADLARPVRVILWGHDPDEVLSVARARVSPRLPGFRLPQDALVTPDAAEALNGARLVVAATPVQFIRETWTKFAPHVPRDAGVVSVAKGIEMKSLERPTQVLTEVLEDQDSRPRPIAALSGPTIASELARCLPATMIAASDDPAFAAAVQRLFSTNWLRIYTRTDVIGVEIAGAVKNIIAIAAGILDGLQAGYNAKSALLSRGLAEISRLGAAMGADADTFFGIASVGDLATTCFSPEGRNRSCGEALGKGVKLKDYLAKSASVVEGVYTTKAVVRLAKKYKVDMPITTAVHAVLFEGTDPIEAISGLMSREMKAERVG